jgi:hypothetical protein
MRTRLRMIAPVLILLALLAGDMIATHNVLTKPHPGHNDFMSRWEGARSYWRDGLNPYGDRASMNIQQRIYGRAAQADEDPGYFAYPFYTVFLIGPLAYLSYAWASAIWMVVLEICLIGAAILLVDLFRLRLKPWLVAILLLWTLLFYFAARGLLLGQPGLLVYFLQVLALWGLAKRRDRLAGAALAVSTIKPQMEFLLVPFLLLWAWRTRRWTFLAAFALLWGGLMLAAFALVPSWFGDWIEQLRQYPSYTALGAPVWIVIQHYLGLGPAVEWMVNLAILAVLGWAAYQVLARHKVAYLDWTVALILTITNLVAIRTATPHYVMFTFPLMFYWRMLSQRAHGSQLIVLLLALLFLIPWIHFLLTVEGEFEHPTVYLPLPLGMFLILWLTRRWWWASPSVLAGGQA